MYYPQPATAQVPDGALSMCVSLGEYHSRLNSEPSVFALGFPVVDIPGVSGCFGGMSMLSWLCLPPMALKCDPACVLEAPPHRGAY